MKNMDNIYKICYSYILKKRDTLKDRKNIEMIICYIKKIKTLKSIKEILKNNATSKPPMFLMCEF